MLTSSPEIGFDQIDILWELTADRYVKDGILKLLSDGTVHYFAAIDQKVPTAYAVHPLSLPDIRREEMLHTIYTKHVGFHSEYLGNMRVGGDTLYNDEARYLVYIRDQAIIKARNYSAIMPAGYFLATLRGR